jgi:hypothetical protein
VKLWVVCIICAVTVSNLNYSYNIFVLVLVIYTVTVSLDSFLYVDSCLNFLCDICYCLCNCAI